MDNYHRAGRGDDKSTEPEDGSTGGEEDSPVEAEDESKRYEWLCHVTHNVGVANDDDEEETQDDLGPIIDNLEGETSGNEDESKSDEEEEDEEDTSQDETVQSDREAGEAEFDHREEGNVNNSENEEGQYCEINGDKGEEKEMGEDKDSVSSEEEEEEEKTSEQEQAGSSSSLAEVAELSASGSRKHKHPYYAKMIRCAIASMGDRGGSTHRTIVTHIMARFDVPRDRKLVSRLVTRALGEGVKRKAFKKRRAGPHYTPLYKLVEGASSSKSHHSSKKRPVAARKLKRPRARSVCLSRKGSRQPLTTRSDNTSKLIVPVFQKRRRRRPNIPKPVAHVKSKKSSTHNSDNEASALAKRQGKSKHSVTKAAVHQTKAKKSVKATKKQVAKSGGKKDISLHLSDSMVPAVARELEPAVVKAMEAAVARATEAAVAKATEAAVARATQAAVARASEVDLTRVTEEAVAKATEEAIKATEGAVARAREAAVAKAMEDAATRTAEVNAARLKEAAFAKPTRAAVAKAMELGVDVADLLVEPEEEEEMPPVKRPVGRPRKHPKVADGQPVVKRPRGRPRKSTLPSGDSKFLHGQ